MNFLKLNLLLNNDWITIVFLVVFSLLVAVKLIYKERLFELLILPISKKYFLKYGKETPLIYNGFNTLLFIILNIILSLIILVFAIEYKPELVASNSFNFFIKINIGVALFFLSRFLLGYFLGLLFETKQQQLLLSFAKINYLFNSALLILPFLLFTFFIKKHNFLVFQFTLLLFSTLLIIRYIFVFRTNKSLIQKKWSNFFLYLCALEIAPLLLILKIVN